MQSTDKIDSFLLDLGFYFYLCFLIVGLFEY